MGEEKEPMDTVPTPQPAQPMRRRSWLAPVLFLLYTLDIGLVVLVAPPLLNALATGWAATLDEGWLALIGIMYALPTLIIGVGLVLFLSGKAWQDRAARRELVFILAAPLVYLLPLSILYIPQPISAAHLKILLQVGRRDFDGAHLKGADLSRLDLSETYLRRANLRGANLTGADLSGARLYGAYLGQADLRQANLVETWLSGADLSEADLSGADLSRKDLSEADLSGADLSGADLSGACLRKTKLDDATRLDPRWRLVWSIVNEGGANRDLHGADLREACLGGAHLSRADLSGADLSGTDLGSADLSGADLSGANLSRADLGYADLSGANLMGADLSGANLSRVNLSGANLSEAKVYAPDLDETKSLKGATMPDGTVHK